MPIKFPGATDRVYIVGRTGSGKTTAGVWHLSGRDFNKQPWLIVNTKGDRFLNELASIEGVQNIGVNDTPGYRGLYHVRPHPREEAAELNDLFGRVWDHGNIGVFIDEGYMIEINDNMIAMLTQGRDRHIPVIVLTQRPAWITKFVESEADFVQLFNLSRQDDRKNISKLVPVDKDYRLERFCSYWYNVNDDDLVKFGPVPNGRAILDTFRAKLPPEQAQEAGAAPAQKRVMTKRVI